MYSPSLTKSKIASSIIKNNLIEESIAKMHPLKRIGKGIDSENLANFLLTSKSSWITGQIIPDDALSCVALLCFCFKFKYSSS